MDKANSLNDMVNDPRYKIISFDIFDTLIVRPCISPSDIFSLAGRAAGYSGAFSDIRRACEAAARRENAEHEDITAESIYSVMARCLALSKEQSSRLSDAEKDCEFSLLRPRNSVRKIYEAAKNAGKDIIIISDMYLSSAFLDKILGNCGYTGYKKLYVSSEYDAAKNSGKLYRIVADDLKKQGVSPSEVLHIGDNHGSDVDKARRNGFSACHIPSTISAADRDPYFRMLLTLNGKKGDNTFLIGFSLHRAFDALSAQPCGDAFIHDIGKTTEMVLAPLMMSFAANVLSDCRKNGVKRLVFLRKDGCFFESVVRTAAEHICPALEIERALSWDCIKEYNDLAVYAAEETADIDLSVCRSVYALFSENGSPTSDAVCVAHIGRIFSHSGEKARGIIKNIADHPVGNSSAGDNTDEICRRISEYCRDICTLFGTLMCHIAPDPYPFYEFLRETLR